MTQKQCLPILLLAVLFPLAPYPGGGAGRAAEEYSPSRSGAGDEATTLRLTLQGAPGGAATVPKRLSELQSLTGPDFLCTRRGPFLVAGNLQLPDYEYLVDGVLDYCAKALVATFFDRGPVAEKTVSIFVFRDYDTYETGLRRFFGVDPISPYGHYGHSQKYIVVNYETGPGTMVHELTHALMAEDFPDAPIWLAEGMASLYEHCRAEGSALRGDDNWRLPELRRALDEGTLESLAGLLAMTPEEFRARNESLNYARARYFCKYLEELGVLPRVYRRFRDRYSLDPTGEGAVAAELGKPLSAVEAAWRRWITFQYWRE